MSPSHPIWNFEADLGVEWGGGGGEEGGEWVFWKFVCKLSPPLSYEILKSNWEGEMKFCEELEETTLMVSVGREFFEICMHTHTHTHTIWDFEVHRGLEKIEIWSKRRPNITNIVENIASFEKYGGWGGYSEVGLHILPLPHAYEILKSMWMGEMKFCGKGETPTKHNVGKSGKTSSFENYFV